MGTTIRGIYIYIYISRESLGSRERSLGYPASSEESNGKEHGSGDVLVAGSVDLACGLCRSKPNNWG